MLYCPGDPNISDWILLEAQALGEMSNLTPNDRPYQLAVKGPWPVILDLKRTPGPANAETSPVISAHDDPTAALLVFTFRATAKVDRDALADFIKRHPITAELDLWPLEYR